MNVINVSDQVNLGRQSIENRLSELRRNSLSEAELLLQSQLLAQIRIFVTNNQQHSQTLQAYQLANQNTINASPAMRDYLQLNQLKRRLQEVLNSNGNLFQQAEIVCQQIALISSSPQGHTLLPKITHIASSFLGLPVKLWSPIPQASHFIVHVPLSGMITFYHLFKKAHTINLPVPDLFIRNGVFISQIDFQLLYSRQADKRNLWNVIFDLRRIEHGDIQLAFGMKTDGRMISVLYEKAAINRVPQNQKETVLQKTHKNINN
ncbi:hypothetical protein EDC96DRAFT_571725 [Choanephora cucurbitarum]|nr:hypothetical protein EDC96DRAFT_571725 [Choanephora cucurbitarum]